MDIFELRKGVKTPWCGEVIDGRDSCIASGLLHAKLDDHDCIALSNMAMELSRWHKGELDALRTQLSQAEARVKELEAHSISRAIRLGVSLDRISHLEQENKTLALDLFREREAHKWAHMEISRLGKKIDEREKSDASTCPPHRHYYTTCRCS